MRDAIDHDLFRAAAAEQRADAMRTLLASLRAYLLRARRPAATAATAVIIPATAEAC